jgi:hypothetical protein
MEFLPSIIRTPAQVHDLFPSKELYWQDIPERLLQATGSTSERNRDSMWIWIREMDRGMSRYLVSDAFARDVAPLSLIQETWKLNQQSVVDLFLLETCKHTQAFAHQIGLYSQQGKRPECSRLTHKTQSQGSIQVEQIACLDIVDLNRSYYFLEYIPASTNTDKDTLLEMSVVDLDEQLRSGDDHELQLFLDLMEEALGDMLPPVSSLHYRFEEKTE